MIIRFKYERGRELKYLAHLDMMTLFERALKRACIDVAFSNGFNKRPLLVFGMPISLGMISLAEYVDITLRGNIECDDFIEKMNKELPLGVRIIRAKEIKSQKNIMSTITFAKYTVEIEDNEKLDEAITRLLKEKEIFIEKVKKGEKIQKEIRNGIITAEVKGKKIDLFMTSGQNRNIKPEEFISALNQYTSNDIEIIDIIREEMYIMNDLGEPVSLFDRRKR